MKKLKTKLKKNKILVIAEMACSHDGQKNKAIDIAKAAFLAKADIIQLQIWKIKNMMSPRNPNFNRIKQIQFTEKDWSDIFKEIRKKFKKLKIYVCVYEHISLDFILSLKPDGIKVNSSDLTNEFLLKKISNLSIPINLSVGSSSQKEIDYAMSFFKKKKPNLMYGFQIFPTPINAINLKNINYLKNKYLTTIGYQDHTKGDDISGFNLSALSIGFGAAILEKHITINRKKTKFDAESALEPKEFKNYVHMVKVLESSFNFNQPLKLNKLDFKYRKFQKKSFSYVGNLPKGHKLSEKDFMLLRNNYEGIDSTKIKKFIGKRLKKNKKNFSIVKITDI